MIYIPLCKRGEFSLFFPERRVVYLFFELKFEIVVMKNRIARKNFRKNSNSLPASEYDIFRHTEDDTSKAGHRFEH